MDRSERGNLEPQTEIAPVTPAELPAIQRIPLLLNASTDAFKAFLLQYSGLTEPEIKGIIGTILHAKKELSSRNDKGKEPKWSVVSASPQHVDVYATTRKFTPERAGNRLPVRINFPTVENGIKRFREKLVEFLGGKKKERGLPALSTGSHLSREVKTSELDEPVLPGWMDHDGYDSGE